MKICIYGAGAIGGMLGAHLARIGEDVTLIARGTHLAATSANGPKVSGARGNFTVNPRATDRPAEIGPQDYVIVALKAHGVAREADRMGQLQGPDTAVVMAVNGVVGRKIEICSVMQLSGKRDAAVLVVNQIRTYW